MPWNDTAQLDYLKAEVREAVIQTILDVARRFPVIRFDAAMTLAKKHIQRLWFPEPGHGGAIASRAEHAMSRAAFDAAIPEEFWREVVDRVAAEVPDTLLLAEAFWLMEGYFVRTLGMHRVYNSAFMHMLRDEDNGGYRLVMKNTLEFDPEILRRYVNFMNNPDEKTAVEQFGKGDKYFGVATLMATLPGLPMFGHGQVEGFAEKYGMEYRRAYHDETPDGWLVDRHEREIFPLLHRRWLFAGVDDFLLYDVMTDDGHVNEDVFAYSNRVGRDRALIVYNNQYADAHGLDPHERGLRREAPGRLEGGHPARPRPRARPPARGRLVHGDARRRHRARAHPLEPRARRARARGPPGRLRPAGAHRHPRGRGRAGRAVRPSRRPPRRSGRAEHRRGTPRAPAAARPRRAPPPRRGRPPPADRRRGHRRGASEGDASGLRAEAAGRVDAFLGVVRDATGTPGDAGAIAARVGDDLAAILRLRDLGEPGAAAAGDEATAAAVAAVPAPERPVPATAPATTAGDAAADAGDEAAIGAPIPARAVADRLLAGDRPAWAALLGWLVTRRMGELAPGTDPTLTSRAWLDELRLGGALAGIFRGVGLDESEAWRAADLSRLLVRLPTVGSPRADADAAGAEPTASAAARPVASAPATPPAGPAAADGGPAGARALLAAWLVRRRSPPVHPREPLGGRRLVRAGGVRGAARLERGPGRGPGRRAAGRAGRRRGSASRDRRDGRVAVAHRGCRVGRVPPRRPAGGRGHLIAGPPAHPAPSRTAADPRPPPTGRSALCPARAARLR